MCWYVELSMYSFLMLCIAKVPDFWDQTILSCFLFCTCKDL